MTNSERIRLLPKSVSYETVRNFDWNINKYDDKLYDSNDARLAVLMDIRGELQQLNRIFGCPNVAAGFRALQRIARMDEARFKARVANAVRKRLKRRAKA